MRADGAHARCGVTHEDGGVHRCAVYARGVPLALPHGLAVGLADGHDAPGRVLAAPLVCLLPTVPLVGGRERERNQQGIGKYGASDWLMRKRWGATFAAPNDIVRPTFNP